MTSEPRYISYDEARDIFATKADLAQLETRLIKWMVGVMLGGMATAATLSVIVLRVLGG